VRKFELKEEHLKLLRKAHIGWNGCEFGAPEIDPKRPYGNSSVYGDIAEILGIATKCPHCGREQEGFTEEQEELMDNLHSETQTALQLLIQHGKIELGTSLQLLIQHGKIELGTYIADDYKNNWKKEMCTGG